MRKEALSFFEDNPRHRLSNGPDNDRAIELITNILACEGVIGVYVNEDDEDALFIEVEDVVEPQLAIELGDVHADECGWDGDLIRIWWD